MPEEKKEFALSDFTPYEMKEGEEYMNEAQLEHFAKILRNWKQELMEEVDRTKEHMKTELHQLRGSERPRQSGRRVQSGAAHP